MQYQYNDGGRNAAGFKGITNDCVVRAIAIAAEMDYAEVYKSINQLAKKNGESTARNGVSKKTTKQYMQKIGWRWVATMQIGQGCKVHLKADELPQGRLVVSVSKHLVAVIDGVAHDNHDPRRGGTRCVYGYWIKP